MYVFSNIRVSRGIFQGRVGIIWPSYPALPLWAFDGPNKWQRGMRSDASNRIWILISWADIACFKLLDAFRYCFQKWDESIANNNYFLGVGTKHFKFRSKLQRVIEQMSQNNSRCHQCFDAPPISWQRPSHFWCNVAAFNWVWGSRCCVVWYVLELWWVCL